MRSIFRKQTTLFLLLLVGFCLPAFSKNNDVESMRKLAHQYYQWYFMEHPVDSTSSGIYKYNGKIDDLSEYAYRRRFKETQKYLKSLNSFNTSSWSVDNQIDFALFKSDLEGNNFYEWTLKSFEKDPQIYVNLCTDSIFSLVKKKYADNSVRANDAISRLNAVPGFLEQAKGNLLRPVSLYTTLALESIQGMDSFYTQSLSQLTDGITSSQQLELRDARDKALKSLHEFARWLEAKLPSAEQDFSMGKAKYDFLLHHVFLLPFTTEEILAIGESELARARGTQAWLSERLHFSTNQALPVDEEEFLANYQSHETQLTQFLQEKEVVTLPDYLGSFYIQELPQSLRPTYPGGFMNAPGPYEQDPSGFYFIPTYSPSNQNDQPFFIQAAIKNPLPLLGHEGIPGHFLQISIANHLSNEIRRLHSDGVFQEGWAYYTEEMLDKLGLYDQSPEGKVQVLDLIRLRASRVAVDVNFATGKWNFEQGVDYLVKEGGMDKETATAEAAFAASSPGQKIDYVVGKWQIERLLGRYRQLHSKDFSLKTFHDLLLSQGSMPLSLVTWRVLNDPEEYNQVRALPTNH